MVSALLALILALTGVTRTVDPELTAIAQQRVMEVQADFTHAGQRPGTAEVMTMSAGLADPVSVALREWQGSPSHWAVLSDPAYTRIGCAASSVTLATGEYFYFVCELGPVPHPTAPSALRLPDTAT